MHPSTLSGSRRLALTLAVGLMSACGGGGGGGDAATSPPPPPVTPPPPGVTGVRVSGTISPAPDSAIDRDTADSNSIRASNNTIATAQAQRNPVSIGGFADQSTDTLDIYRADFAAGQILTLFVAEDGATNDLDLGLFDLAGNLVDASVSTTNREALTVSVSGEYLVAVEAFSGGSNYILALGSAGSSAAAADPMMSTQADFFPDEVLIAYQPDVLASSLKRAPALEALGLPLMDEIPGVLERRSLGAPFQRSAVMANLGLDPRATPTLDPELADKYETLLAIKRMQRMPGVRLAEPNGRLHASLEPRDEFFSSQWHYQLVNLPAAWAVTSGSSNVLAAVIDSGVLLGHPDLAGKFDPSDPSGFDFVSDAARSNDGNGRDDNADDPGDERFGGSSFHGTHVAGTIGAATDNTLGVSGAGFNTRIMPLRALGAGGSGSSFDVLDAVRYAAGLSNSSGRLPARRADVMNLSLGSTGSSSQSGADALAAAVAQGVIVVAAAGNDGTSGRAFPASYPGVVSVGAVGPAINGPPRRASYSQFNSAVDVAAPGGDISNFGAQAGGILSTRADDNTGAVRFTVGYLQGTSMAAPHVAGIVALMKAVHPALTPQQFDQLLASGAITRDLGPAGRDNDFGHGLIDAAAAVREAQRLAAGSAPPDRPNLAVEPGALDFGSGSTALTLNVRNSGTGTLTVNAPTDDAPWLTLTLEQTQNQVQTFAARVNRTGLADGLYRATIRFDSSANDVDVPVLMRVGGAPENVDAGLHYVLLLDPVSGDPIAQQIVPIASGRYAYAFSNVAPGSYQIISGTDSDDDGFICDSGEACGAYTTLDSLTEIVVNQAAVSTLDFGTGFAPAVFATGADAGAAKSGAAPATGMRGFRIHPRPAPAASYSLSTVP